MGSLAFFVANLIELYYYIYLAPLKDFLTPGRVNIVMAHNLWVTQAYALKHMTKHYAYDPLSKSLPREVKGYKIVTKSRTIRVLPVSDINQTVRCCVSKLYFWISSNSDDISRC